jgi:hypothetical protein
LEITLCLRTTQTGSPRKRRRKEAYKRPKRNIIAKNKEEYRKIAARPLKLLGVGVSGHVFVVNNYTVVKVALKNSNAYRDNELLRDHLIKRSIYERLGKHNRICEFKYAIDRGLVRERLKQCLRERLKKAPRRGAR